MNHCLSTVWKWSYVSSILYFIFANTNLPSVQNLNKRGKRITSMYKNDENFGLREISKMTGEQVHVKDGISWAHLLPKTLQNYNYIESKSLQDFKTSINRIALPQKRRGSHVETGESDKDNLTRAPTPMCWLVERILQKWSSSLKSKGCKPHIKHPSSGDLHGKGKSPLALWSGRASWLQETEALLLKPSHTNLLHFMRPALLISKPYKDITQKSTDQYP